MKQRAKTNSIRIISGQWRGRRLPVLEIDGLRPTTDRVRETLFNWLMYDVNGAVCLDLFAGSGALGLESLSRGADRTVFIESNRQAASQLQKNLAALGVAKSSQVFNQSAIGFLDQAAHTQFDLVFLDPPFDSQLLPQVLPLLLDNGWLSPEALIYVEQASDIKSPIGPKGWEIYKHGKAGYCQYALYRA